MIQAHQHANIKLRLLLQTFSYQEAQIWFPYKELKNAPKSWF